MWFLWVYYICSLIHLIYHCYRVNFARPLIRAASSRWKPIFHIDVIVRAWLFRKGRIRHGFMFIFYIFLEICIVFVMLRVFNIYRVDLKTENVTWSRPSIRRGGSIFWTKPPSPEAEGEREGEESRALFMMTIKTNSRVSWD